MGPSQESNMFLWLIYEQTRSFFRCNQRSHLNPWGPSKQNGVEIRSEDSIDQKPKNPQKWRKRTMKKLSFGNGISTHFTCISSIQILYISPECACVCVCVIHLRTLTLASFCRQRTTPTSHFLHGNLRGIPQCHPPQANSLPYSLIIWEPPACPLGRLFQGGIPVAFPPQESPMIAVLQAKPPEADGQQQDHRSDPPENRIAIGGLHIPVKPQVKRWNG